MKRYLSEKSTNRPQLTDRPWRKKIIVWFLLYICSLRLIEWLRKRSVRRNVVRSVKYLPEREALHDHIVMHHVCTHEYIMLHIIYNIICVCTHTHEIIIRVWTSLSAKKEKKCHRSFLSLKNFFFCIDQYKSGGIIYKKWLSWYCRQ